MRKIAAHWYEPDGSDRGPWSRKVAAALRIEAKAWRSAGNREAAHALELVAGSMHRVADGDSYAKAFGWPEQERKQ